MWERVWLVIVVGALLGGVACQRSSPPPPNQTAAAQPVRPPSSPSSPAATRPRIVFLGDSLTAGLGLPTQQSYPAIIQRRLEEQRYAFEVVNAGVSGDTSAGGLRRLDWALEGDVKVLIVALGANDALRGLAPSELRKNLVSILDVAAARHVTVVLAGMEAPPNNGREYTDQFRAVYVDLAKTYHVRLVPFLLDGVAGDPSLNQADGIHPNARGAEIVAELVWQQLKPTLDRLVTP